MRLVATLAAVVALSLVEAMPLVTSWAGLVTAVGVLVLASLAVRTALRRARGRGTPAEEHAADLTRLIDADPDLILFSVVPEPGEHPSRPRLRVTLSEGGGLARVGLRPGQVVGSYVDEWPGEDAAHYYEALRVGHAAWTQPYPSDPLDPESPPRTFAYHATRDPRGGLIVRVVDATGVRAGADEALADAEAERVRRAAAETDLAALRDSARAERDLHRAEVRALRARIDSTDDGAGTRPAGARPADSRPAEAPAAEAPAQPSLPSTS